MLNVTNVTMTIYATFNEYEKNMHIMTNYLLSNLFGKLCKKSYNLCTFRSHLDSMMKYRPNDTTAVYKPFWSIMQ